MRLPFDVVTQFASSGLTESEVERATLFMHDLGEVFYDKKAAPDVVFLKVGYLIDAMKFIIRHDHGEATSYAAERHRHVVGVRHSLGPDFHHVDCLELHTCGHT